jgi:hypothetical protein
MPDVYIHYKGNGPLTIPYPPRGAEYTFKPACKNIVDGEVWNDLSKPGGPAFVFLKKFGRTSKPGAGDLSHRVTPVKMPPKTARQTPAERASDQRDLVAAQQAEIDRLRDQLAAAASTEPAVDEDLAADQFEESEQDGRDSELAELRALVQSQAARIDELLAAAKPAVAKPVPAPEPVSDAVGAIDPSKLAVNKLPKALEGLDLDELERIKTAEQGGRNRAGAIEVIDAAINKLLEAEEQG